MHAPLPNHVGESTVVVRLIMLGRCSISIKRSHLIPVSKMADIDYSDRKSLQYLGQGLLE